MHGNGYAAGGLLSVFLIGSGAFVSADALAWLSIQAGYAMISVLCFDRTRKQRVAGGVSDALGF
ncbi:hypothetical protein XYCOK13_18250 [Xylanibacillus composti]|uniref:Uncharacterized protein n=1 Tax=Xylanibacillus composti TaxID=1572762 RepID=A0A8J4H3S3_9BACL|nr:hypothetical protein XYCOK13_18250 [Xylanibacillus composti]